MKKEGKKRKSSHVWYLHAHKNKQNKQTNKQSVLPMCMYHICTNISLCAT